MLKCMTRDMSNMTLQAGTSYDASHNIVHHYEWVLPTPNKKFNWKPFAVPPYSTAVS
jgi:hypothetical protein